MKELSPEVQKVLTDYIMSYIGEAQKACVDAAIHAHLGVWEHVQRDGIRATRCLELAMKRANTAMDMLRQINEVEPPGPIIMQRPDTLVVLGQHLPKPKYDKSLYDIPPDCICFGDGLNGVKCNALEHAKLKSAPACPGCSEANGTDGWALVHHDPPLCRTTEQRRADEAKSDPPRADSHLTTEGAQE